MPADSTLLDLLARAGRLPDGGLRFVDRDERATWMGWGEVRERALAAAARLQALGVAPGERVALVFPTGPDFFTAFFGTLLAGAVPVPLYPPVRLGRLEEYVERTARMLLVAEARLVLAERRIKAVLGEVVARARPPLGCRTLAALPEAAGVFAPPAVAAGDLALVQFSSGTTVEPKAVALAHRAVLAQVRSLDTFFYDTPELRESGASWLPLYHDMGLIGCVFPALHRDTSLTLVNPEHFVARPALWLRAIARWRGTVSPAPNFGYALSTTRIRDEEMEGVDLSSWRLALNGAEPVAPAVLRAFSDRFARWGFRPEALTPVYGLSEAALAVTFSETSIPFRSRRLERETLARDAQAVDAPGGMEIPSVGRPIPGFEIEIRDEAGRALPERRVGRVWTRGPSVMDGYLGDPAATARALCDGWLDTGDLGFLAEGELYLTGRAKDIILLRGRNYAPEPIEHALEGLPGARPGCAVAVSWLPEGAPGEVLGLLVERRRRARAEEVERLPAACRAAVLRATGLDADHVVVLPPGTLPRTSSGKLRRAEALRLHLAGELAPPLAVTPLHLARAVARSHLAYARLGRRRGDRS